MKVAITGTTGFVGGRILKNLIFNNVRCRSIERNASGNDVICHDLMAPFPERAFNRLVDTDVFIHAAGNVSGAASLRHPRATVTDNLISTFNVLELARSLPKLKKFIYISTGEAVGAVPEGVSYDETATLHPSNPYSASKAAAEELCRAYRLNFGVPVIVVRSMNLFGPGQSKSRYVPKVIKALLRGDIIPCHVGKDGRPGSRNWLHISDFISDLRYVAHEDNADEIYHVVGPERTNQQVIDVLAKALRIVPKVEYVVAPDSHDMRYALCSRFVPKRFDTIDGDLAATAWWYANNTEALL